MVPSGAVGKAFADGFYVFADGFGHSAKDLFPVVLMTSQYCAEEDFTWIEKFYGTSASLL
jgi:hypothetical protein